MLDGAIEKPNLKLGFIKLTDMAPLAIAKEKGFFAEEGLNVTLEPQANWKVLLDGVIGGQLDGAHMLAGQPLAATIGYRHQGRTDRTAQPRPERQCDHAFEQGLGPDQAPICPRGRMARSSIPFRPRRSSRWSLASSSRASRSTWAWSSRSALTITSCATGWRQAGSIPASTSRGDVAGVTGADVQLSVTPPPQMPATLEAGTIEGYS